MAPSRPGIIQAGTIGGRMAIARQRWTSLERRLWTAVRRGDLVDLRAAEVDPRHVWGPARTVRAEVLRELLISGPAPLPGHIGGLRLAGARVTGPLDLAHGRLDLPFAFLECWFDEPIDLSAARTRAVVIRDCRMPGLRADGLHTDGDLDLRGALCTAELDLTDARIGGSLTLSRAQLANPGDVALRIDGAHVANDVFCRDGFRATGEVRLLLSRIDGDLDLSAATMANPAGAALMVVSAKIGGRLFANEGFRASGRTDLSRTTIGLGLNLVDATFDHPDGVALAADATQIGGNLSAHASVVSGEFSLTGAQVDGWIALDGAVLSNPGGMAFNGDGLHAAAGVYGRERLQVTGEFWLANARIDTSLDFSTAVLANPGEHALTAMNLVVNGDAFFNRGFTVDGVVRLVGAHVRGQLNLEGARLSNPGGLTLIANNLVVDSDIFVDGCRIDGEIRLMRARVGSDLYLDRTEIHGEDGTLNAEGADIGGNLFCCYGFNSTGEIRLGGARIGHQLLLRGATLDNAAGTVVRARHLVVGHDILADDDFTVHGTLDLSRARVAGRIALDAKDVDGDVTLAQATTDRLRLIGTPRGRVDLTDMTVRVLHHDPQDWPEAGELDLHGLTYTTLKPLDLPATRWLDWLRRGLPDGYRPQPYAQLATTLRTVGNDREARVVLLARQRHRRRHLPLWSKPWGWLQDVAVGYGYVPWRAAGWLAVLWLAGWLYFRVQQPLPGGAGDYQPALYALDLLLPVLSIGQRSAFHFAGPAQLVGVVMTVCSWILGIAVLAGLTRALTRN
jgi:hypothetical protein